ncbi:nucleotidyltransferase family protein [Oceanicola sp. 502str15]|uniref:nucleotidyltransferase family protein n=1 Tax=Oceanicola sp. 502str15 TaxID=2696061 RepID=UPI0020949B9E|nr:nucleotidyltransferase family protein [Oceanicola sp. 502str15]MCO6384170.1 NTP transferase domain-containing protein [Oceanicola sp. 502str15]
MSDPQAAMIFAAGFGTRMRPLTDTRPKPLIKVAGKPLLDRALDLTEGTERVVVNTHYLGDQIARHLAGRTVQTIHEPEILDTGGGLRNALPLLGTGPVITLNSDAVWTGPNPLQTLRNAWKPDRMDALLLLIPVANARGYEGTGDFSQDADGRLTRGPGLIYSGAQIIKPDGLAQIPEAAFSLNVLWNVMQPEGRLFGVVHPGGWCDVGHPGGIAEAEAMLANV